MIFLECMYLHYPKQLPKWSNRHTQNETCSLALKNYNQTCLLLHRSQTTVELVLRWITVNTVMRVAPQWSKHELGAVDLHLRCCQ